MKQTVLIALAALSQLAWPAVGASQTTMAFGPTQYTRVAGPTQVFTATFQHCGTSPCQLVVTNGHADGTNRVISSAYISLNGNQILGPNDFNQLVGTVIAPVVLAASNQLKIVLASNPGSFLTVQIQCVGPSASLSAQSPGASLFDAFGYGFNSAPPPATGKVADVHYVQFGRPASSCNVIIIK